MVSPFKPENYRWRAVIDWVTVRVTLANLSQFRHVQSRLLTHFGKLLVKACDGDASSLRFDITFQDPDGPNSIMQGLQSALSGDDLLLTESDVQVVGLELAVDLYSRTSDPESLAPAALHMAVHHARPPLRQARICKTKKEFFVPTTKSEILAELDAGYTLNAGAKNASTSRYYVKRRDTIDGAPYMLLPSSQHRARFENTWCGHVTPPFHTMVEWRNFRFESLSEQFALVTPTPATPLAALLQDLKTQLGRSLDRTGGELRHPDAMATSQLPSYRRKRASGTRRDTAANERIRQALRNLTVRSKQESPREFGGFCEELTASPIGDCLNTVQSPLYLNTDKTSPVAVSVSTNTTNTPNTLQLVTTDSPNPAPDSLNPAIDSPTHQTHFNQSPLTLSNQPLIHQPQRNTRHAAWPTG